MGLHLRHLDYPGLHRDGWVKRGQKHGLRVCLNVFESLLFLFVGEMLILMPFVHQRSRITFNKPTMSGSVCHMSFTATQDPYDPARGKTTVPRIPCVATQERIVHNCTYPLDDPHQVTVRRPNCTHSSLATLLE